MKAEDFLKRNHHTVSVKHESGDISEEEDVSLDVSIEAVDRARCEERSKALSCFEAVLIEASVKTSNGEIIGVDELKKEFKKLINK